MFSCSFQKLEHETDLIRRSIPHSPCCSYPLSSPSPSPSYTTMFCLLSLPPCPNKNRPLIVLNSEAYLIALVIWQPQLNPRGRIGGAVIIIQQAIVIWIYASCIFFLRSMLLICLQMTVQQGVIKVFCFSVALRYFLFYSERHAADSLLHCEAIFFCLSHIYTHTHIHPPNMHQHQVFTHHLPTQTLDP